MQIKSVKYFCDKCKRETPANEMHDIKFVFHGWRCAVGGAYKHDIYTAEVCRECYDAMQRELGFMKHTFVNDKDK